MTSFFHKLKSNLQIGERGQIMVLLGMLTVVGILGVAISLMIGGAGKVFQLKMTRSRTTLENSNAAETMLVAYRLAEVKYTFAVSAAIGAGQCPSGQANPFILALQSGSGCNIPGNIRIWDSSDTTDQGTIADSITGRPYYTYPANAYCVISYSNFTCCVGTTCGASASPNILNTNFNSRSMTGNDIRGVANNTQQAVGNYGYQFGLAGVRPAQEQVDFNANFTDSSGIGSRLGFSIIVDLPNAAHVDSDFKIVQENPDPLALCNGTPWGIMQLFVPALNQCVTFTKLGGATGLAFYNGTYFGFDPNSGNVISDLAIAQGISPYIVNTDGTLGGVATFPPYDQTQLRFVNDITTISNEIYYVAGVGPGAVLGVLNPNTLVRENICNLGAMGFSQAYAGITALGMSDPLVPPVGGDALTSRMATFFLKTETGFSAPNVGPLLTAEVTADQNGDPSSFQCAVFKDLNIQQSEYTRTYGFDRTAFSKPYYLN